MIGQGRFIRKESSRPPMRGFAGVLTVHPPGGFTIIELMVAVMVGLMMLGLAVPSVRGLLEEQRLREKMASFEEVVRRAAAQAASAKREVRLIWVEEGSPPVSRGVRAFTDWSVPKAGEIASLTQAASQTALAQEDAGGGEGVFFPLGEGEWLSLVRVAARDDRPTSEWSFWPSGIREPVEVYYEGPLGKWALRFSALVPDSETIYFQLN
jgi:type II secretory pathway pseudopilin PulG